MKKISMLLLGAAGYCYAHAQTVFLPAATPVSQTVFNPVEAGAQSNNFFVTLSGNNRIWFDLNRLSDLNQVSDPDSLFRLTANLLGPMLSDFSADGIVRRIDVDATRQPAIFRVIEHRGQPVAFVKQDDALAVVKMDQDTLRIKVLLHEQGASFITLLLNNAADITQLAPGVGKESLQLVKEAVEKNYSLTGKYKSRFQFYGSFDLESGKLLAPKGGNYHAIKAGKDYLELVLLNPSLGFARGQFYTGVSLGATLNFSSVSDRYNSTHSFGLLWEPQFTFGQDADNKVVTRRNDFLTFSYEKSANQPKPFFTFMNKVSLGYLIRQKGDLFEKNTFRLGISGISNGRFQLEPEFYFNEFFKNVSPGIRMTLRLTR